MERPEAQDSGSIILTGFESQNVINSINLVIQEHNKHLQKVLPAEYVVPDTSAGSKTDPGLASLSNKWHGILV